MDFLFFTQPLIATHQQDYSLLDYWKHTEMNLSKSSIASKSTHKTKLIKTNLFCQKENFNKCDLY